MTLQLTESRAGSKAELYEALAAQLSSLLAGERDLIANAANFSSLIFHSLPDLNWAGFYFAKDGELVLGSPGKSSSPRSGRLNSRILLVISRPLHGLRFRFTFAPTDESVGYFHVVRAADENRSYFSGKAV